MFKLRFLNPLSQFGQLNLSSFPWSLSLFLVLINVHLLCPSVPSNEFL